MRIQLLFVVLLLLLAACAPTREDIQSTVEAAMAQTETAEPTPTATLTPVPTETPAPSPTPHLNQLADKLNITIQLLQGPTRAIDVRYMDSAEGLILQIDAKSISEEYDERDILADVFTALHRSYEEGFPYAENLFALHVVGYDLNLERQGTFVSEWTDMVAWFEGEISTEQLILRLIFLP